MTGGGWWLHSLGGLTNVILCTPFTVSCSFCGPHQLGGFIFCELPSLLALTGWIASCSSCCCMWFLLLHLSCSLYNSDQTVCDPVHLPVHQQAHPNIGKSGQQGKTYSTFPSFRTALGLIFGTQALICVCNDLGKTLERKNLWPCSTYHWAPGWTFWFYSWRAKEWRRPWGKLLINQVVLIIFTALQNAHQKPLLLY